MKAAVTYGKLTIEGKRIILADVKPHVSIRLKSVFARIPKEQTKTFNLPYTDEMCADVLWFMDRFPFQISQSHMRILKDAAARFRDDRAMTEAILMPDWKATEIGKGFRPGYAPNFMQRQAIELLKRRKRLLVGDDVGLGKEQPLTAKILTPTGWSTMGEMKVGTEVIGAGGRTCRVTGVYPQGMKPVYRIVFSDGAATECGLDHLWVVRDQNRRLRGRGWTVVPLSHLLKHGILSKSLSPKWEIPLTEPVDFARSSTPLPIHPYLLGVLLGDGHFNRSNICLSIPEHKSETLDRVKEIVGSERITGPYGDTCPQWHIIGEKPLCNSIARALKSMNLRVKSPFKFIPDIYLFASNEDRLEVLRGLMDTDGSAKNNRVAFHSKSARLAYGVAHLVRSLGGTAKIHRYDRTHHGKGIEYNVNVRLEVCPFHLRAKAAQWSKCGTHGRVRRYIRSVELIGEAQQQCIAVDSEDHTYLTDNFIVTHNTFVAMGASLFAKPVAVVVEAHLAEQWAFEFIVQFTSLTVHIIDGTAPYSLPRADVYIFRYSNIAGWVDVAATGIFSLVFYDEIQQLRTGLKSAKGRAAKVFSDNAEYSLGLSATPIFGYGSEIWNIMIHIDPDILGSWEEFTREWCRAGPGDKWIVVDPDALGSYLREAGVFIRRLREGRPINKILVNVDYDESAADAAEQMTRALAMKVLESKFGESGQAARELDALARRLTGIGKAKGIAAYARILLSAGIAVLVSCWHRDVYEILLKELKDFKVALYTGSETSHQKDKVKKDFIAGKIDCILISNRSGSGLDGLQKRCHTLIVGELDWANAVVLQLIGRLDRPGQPVNEITLIYCVCDYGSDPTIISVNALKSDQSRGILDPGSGVAESYSDISHIKQLAQAYLERGGA